MRRTGRFEQIKKVILHFNRVVQFPAQLASISHADGIDRAHAQFDLARRQPRKALVRQRAGGISVFDHRA